jgi:hypothetical protein
MHRATMFMGTCLEYVPQLGHTMKDWIMDNVKFGLSIAYMWGNMSNTTLMKTSTENHGLLVILSSHIYIDKIVDLYVSLEYKNHKDVVISINVWVDTNYVNFFSFDQ